MKISLFVFVCLCFCLISCTGIFKGKEVADKGIVEFHRLYNEGKFDEIYDHTDPKFQKASSKKDFLDLLGAVQRKLGKVTAAKEAGYNTRTFNFVTTVSLNQSTTFEQGSGMETFSFEINGDKAMLLGYNINSKDMMMK